MALDLTIPSLFKLDKFIPPNGTKFSFLEILNRLNFVTPKYPFLFLYEVLKQP